MSVFRPELWPELWEAARGNDVAGVRRCLARGDEVDGRGGMYNRTPLMEAATHMNPTVLLLLLRRGADMQACDDRGQTALHKAARDDSVNCVRVLTALGADINAGDKGRNTPVMYAARWNRADTVLQLQEAGADCQAALDMAERRGYKAVVAVLKDPATLRWGHNNMSDDDIQTRLQSLPPGETYRMLLLTDNCLTRVPDLTLYPQLSKLEVLNIANNRLTEVKEEYLPKSVKTVYLGHNNIHTMSPKLVSDWIHSYFNLISKRVESERRQLRLHPNPIVADIQRKVEEGVFDIYGSFHDTQPVDRLPDLSHMETVREVFLPYQDISFIDISHFPAFVENINLNCNVMQSLPNMKHMKSLRKISLSNNKIVVVFGLPSWLQSIEMKGNPIRALHRDCFPSEKVYELLSEALTSDQMEALQQPPPQIFRKGYNAVIQYYDQAAISRLADNSKNRMCLLGEATAGKTSLMQSLMSGVPCLTAEDDRTQVVDTHTWHITDQCSYQIFDQGGHQIYSITNLFFMSASSKNLICHNISDGSMRVTQDVLERTIHLHPTSDVHFVLTKSDLVSDDVANTKMQQFKTELINTFQNKLNFLQKLLGTPKSTELNKEVIEKLILGYNKKIKDSRYFLVSSKLYKGIVELKQFLCELAERDIKTLPELWWNCYTYIDSLQINVLGYEQFQKIFHSGRNMKQKMKAIFKPKSSRIDIVSCLEFYHDCGLALWFKDHPKLNSYIFHNLTYIIDIMKAVFHHQLEQSLNYEDNLNLQQYFQQAEFKESIATYKNQGLLSHRFLSFLWQEYKLDIFDQDVLLEIMKSFDICYPILDLPRDDFTLYFFPFFCKNKQIHSSIDLQHLCVVNYKTITLLLECEFFNSVPINLTDMFIVHLQRHAVENHYLGKRYAWADGLLVIVGTLNIAIVCDKAKSTLYLLVRGGVDVIFEMWAAFLSLYKSLCGLIAQWHGVIRSLHILCAHCVIIGSSKPYCWLPSEVFPEKPCSLLHVSCENEADSVIPAALITLVQPVEKEKHLYAVKEYLQKTWKETHGGKIQSQSVTNTSPALSEPHSSQSGSLHLQNQERELDQTLQMKGTFVLRRLLQRQVLDTWGHELELLLQDTSSGVIVKSGPSSDIINRFQDLIYKNKQVSLFEEERQKLKDQAISMFDISLISKILRVPKISGIDVTQKRWSDFQKGSIEDMLHPKKPGPPGRQEEDNSTDTKLAGLASVIVNLRNNVHNKTDQMNLNQAELETNMNYLSQSLIELIKYIGIPEKEIETLAPNKATLFYEVSYAQALEQAAVLSNTLQNMKGIGLSDTQTSTDKNITGVMGKGQQRKNPSMEASGSAEKTSPGSGNASLVHSYPQQATGLHGTAANYKLTPQESQFVLDQILPSICRINIPGFSGTGFVIGALQDPGTRVTHRYVLTCYHIKLFAALRDQQHCEAQFDRNNAAAVKVKILQAPLYWSQDLDFVLVKLEASQALDNSLANKVSLGQLVTVNIPSHNDALVLCAHTDKQQIDWGARGVSIDHESVRTEHGDLNEINVKRQRTYRDPHIYPISRRFILYQCSCQAGTSGAPCLSASQTRLFAMHCGSVYKGELGMSPEYGVLLKYVVHDIHKKISNPSAVAGSSYMQQGGLQLSDLYSLFPNVPKDLNPASDQVSTMQV